MGCELQWSVKLLSLNDEIKCTLLSPFSPSHYLECRRGDGPPWTTWSKAIPRRCWRNDIERPGSPAQRAPHITHPGLVTARPHMKGARVSLGLSSRCLNTLTNTALVTKRFRKWKVLSRVQLLPTPWTIYTVHGILQARTLEWVAFPFSRGSSQPRVWTQVCHIAGGFFTSWAPGKPKNTGVGHLSFLPWIFLNQESNWGLLIAGRFFTNWATREALRRFRIVSN